MPPQPGPGQGDNEPPPASAGGGFVASRGSVDAVDIEISDGIELGEADVASLLRAITEWLSGAPVVDLA